MPKITDTAWEIMPTQGITMEALNLTRFVQALGRTSLQAGISVLLILILVIQRTDAQATNDRSPADKKQSPAAAPGNTNEVRLGSDPLTTDEANREVKTVTITVVDAETGKPLPQTELLAPYIGRWNEPQPKRLTDANGHYTLRVPVPPEAFKNRTAMFSVSVHRPEYAPRAVGWTASGGDVYAILPNEVTLKLERGIRIGGVVHDHLGKSLSDIRVLLSGSAYTGFTIGAGEQKTHEYSEVHLLDKAAPAAVTDHAGHWSFDHFPSDLKTVEITLIRPDESKATFSTAPGINNVNQFPLVLLQQLQAQKAEFVMPEGLTVHGIVVDELGKPLSGAQVKEGYGHANIERVSEFKTGPEGRFERLNRAPRQWIYTASAAGRATVSVVAQVEPGMTEVRLVLPPANPLLLRVVDQSGQPVQDATAMLDSYRNEGQILDWKATTDADGRLVWTNAPTQEISFYISSQGLGTGRKFRVRADGREKTLVLTRQPITRAAIALKCLDAQTREPVTIRSVSAQYNGEFNFKTIAEPKSNQCNVEVHSTDFKVGMGESYKLKVEADNYEPAFTEYIDLAEGDQSLELALVRGGRIEGVALLPDGTPAAGAQIWLRSSPDSGALFCNSPGKYYGDRLTKVRVASDGKFQLLPAPQDSPVVFTHSNGSLQTTLSKLKSSPLVRLQAWGGIEGRVLTAGAPKSDVRVSLSTLSWSPFLGLHLIYSTTSAADGSFSFTNVPAGEYKLYRDLVRRVGRPITEDHQMPVVVRPGEVTKIDYGQKSRLVVGQAVPDRPDLAVDWLNDDHVLVLKQPPVPVLNRQDFASFKAFQEANDASYSSPARLQLARQARTYQLEFERDGSFRAEDVPPGTYELRIRVTKPNEQQRFGFPSRPEDELGSLVKELAVPDGQASFDLGTLLVPMNADAAGQKAPPVHLTAQTLDGQPLSLDDFKGKHLLLFFWGSWSERSLAQLAELKKLQTQFGQNPSLAFLGVSIDAELEGARTSIETNHYSWAQAWLPAEQRAQVTAAFDVNSLPDVFLIDPAGRIVGRDLEGDRIRLSLQRALAAK